MGTPLKSENQQSAPAPTQNDPAPLGTPGGIAPSAHDSPQPMAGYEDKGPVLNPENRVIMQGEFREQPKPSDAPTLTPEERAHRKARLATILDRGVLHDRLNVQLPPDRYGEWVRNDPLEIDRLRTLGFELETEHGRNHSLHNDGTGSIRVSDVVFMTTSRENKDLIDEVRHEQMMRTHAPRKAREEKELASQVAQATGGIIPTFTDSHTHTARLADVAAAVAEADKQVQPIK